MSDLLILAFDHRGTFLEKLLGVKGRKATFEEAKKIAEYKSIIFDGFMRSVTFLGVPKAVAGLLCDEEFGTTVLLTAKKDKLTFAMPIEKTGQDEFDFDYADWQAHIKKFSPSYTKVLVRYNPEGDKEMNNRQLVRLKMLGDYLALKKRKYLFELLVPATPQQLAACSGDKSRYDVEMRAGLMCKAMEDIQNAGVLPDIWKLEGVDRKEDAEMLVKQAHAAPKKAGIVTLGRGESIDKVKEWLKVGAHTEGIVGFAVGRTIFWEAIEGFHKGQLTRDAAVGKIADNYKSFVDLWMGERK